MKRAVCILVLVLGPKAPVCASEPPAEAQTASFAERDVRYELEPGDVLDVRFPLTPEFNDVVTVQPDGFISLQASGDISVKGLTVPQVTKLVIDSAKILNAPRVTILLKEFTKPAYYVGGNVSKPGRFELHGKLTVTNAITTAGGFAAGSKDSEVVLVRRLSKDYARVEKINVKDILKKGKLSEDVELEPNDAIYVTKSAVGVIDRIMQVSRLGFYFPIPF